jgi:hypothetical protein
MQRALMSAEAQAFRFAAQDWVERYWQASLPPFFPISNPTASLFSPGLGGVLLPAKQCQEGFPFLFPLASTSPSLISRTSNSAEAMASAFPAH